MRHMKLVYNLVGNLEEISQVNFIVVCTVQLNLYCKTYPFGDHPCIEDHILLLWQFFHMF